MCTLKCLPGLLLACQRLLWLMQIFSSLYIWCLTFFILTYFLFLGIPNRLPDAVCPAALLQHVLRPPQQHWETNSAVDRPLAPQLLPAHSYSILQRPLFYWPIISTPMMNLQQKKVEGNKKHLAWWEGKIKDMDMHLSQIPPFSTYLWWKDRLQEKVEEGLGQVPFLKNLTAHHFRWTWERTRGWGWHVKVSGESSNMDGLFCEVLFVI